MHEVHLRAYLFRNKAIRDRILESIRKGHRKSFACKVVGISSHTLRVWLRRGEEDRLEWENLPDGEQENTPISGYHEFLIEFEQAEYHPLNYVLESWLPQVEKDWKAGATFAERRYPDEWARKTMGAEVESDGPVKIQLEW